MPDETPKYYRSIPLVPKRTEPVDRDTAHLVYNSTLHSGRVRGEFVARQPLHVGTGLLVAPQSLGLNDEAPLVKSFFRAGDRLTVPGSSLKGAVRHLVEALTYSAVSKTRVRLDRELYGESQYDSRRGRGELDPAGRIFGAMGYQGHVQFGDCPLLAGQSAIMDIPPQYEPRAGEGRRYYPHGLVDNRSPLWPLEVVEAGGRFAFEMRFNNLSAAELGVLLIAFGQSDPPICLKLGAGKSSGLGAVRFDDVVAETWDPAVAYVAPDVAWTPLDKAACLAAVEQLLRRDETLRRLQADLGCAQLSKQPSVRGESE